jgi:neutral ceramidase
MKAPHSLRLAVLLLLCGASVTKLVRAAEFRAGAARVAITPKNGTPMGGYYHFRGVGGVQDPIYAKTIVVEQDGVHAAFVVLDLSGTTRPLVAEARKLVQEQSGIAPEYVMISATHTHSGPQLPRGSLIDEITKATSAPGMEYVNSLPHLIAQSVRDAKAKLAAAKPSSAVGRAENLAFNRRVLRDGETKAIWQPAKIDPAKDRPAGPVDPDVGLLVFDAATPDTTPIAAYVNFAMHPTSVGSGVRISADYPGVLTKLLSERKGESMIAVFANGACGDINHTNYMAGKRPTTQEIGTILADAAAAAWPNLKPAVTYAPKARLVMLDLPRRKYSDEDIAKAKDVATRMMTEKLGTVPMAEAVSILDTVERSEKKIPLLADVQVISFSDDIAVVALPGEIFVELGLAIKKASPFKHTFIAELANGSVGYVPTRAAFAQGNYEVVSARGAIESGEMIVEAAIKLLNEVKAGK